MTITVSGRLGVAGEVDSLSLKRAFAPVLSAMQSHKRVAGRAEIDGEAAVVLIRDVSLTITVGDLLHGPERQQSVHDACAVAVQSGVAGQFAVEGRVGIVRAPASRRTAMCAELTPMRGAA